MSIDYIFIHEALRDRFVQFVMDRGIPCRVRKDQMDGFVAALPEDLDDSVAEAIDAEYELLMEEQEVLAESDEGWVTSNVMGVEIKLADGRPCVVRIPDAIIRRLSEHFAPEEIHALVSAIAHSVENPVDGPICRMA
ncbi:MAG TPA: hypothetical protein VGD24_06815 [Gallionella sp.]